MDLDVFLPLSSLFVLWCVSSVSVVLLVLHSSLELTSLSEGLDSQYCQGKSQGRL